MRESLAAGDAPAARPEAAPNGAWQLGHRVPLDGLRGIAVLLVLLAHSGDLLWRDARGWLAPGGHLGVHLFFVLSGFLITSLLLTEARRRGGVDLGAFARRRVLRLVPALLPLLGALAVVAALGSRLDLADVGNSALHVLTFSTNYEQLHGEVPVIGWLGGDQALLEEVSHTWSLSVEIHFYVLWAVALWLLTRASWSNGRLVALLVGVIALIVVLRAMAYSGDQTWAQYYFGTWPRLDAPAIGALAAVIVAGGWAARVPRRVLVWCGGACLVALVLAAGTVRANEPALPLGLYAALALCAAAVILAVVVVPAGRLAGGLSWPPLVWLGTISYSLYLWHLWLFMVAARRGTDWSPVLRWVFGMTLAIGAAWASHRFVERRFITRRHA